jgi:hypothetical protein
LVLNDSLHRSESPLTPALRVHDLEVTSGRCSFFVA